MSIRRSCFRCLQRRRRSDYVVVGAGSGGCVTASRLAEAGKKVTLIEAGSWSPLKGPRSILCRMPTALSLPMHWHWSDWNWAYETMASPALNGRKISCPRGKGVGGSSSINGMVYVRGHPMDYDNWKIDGWRWQDVEKYFRKMENYDGPDDDGLRGNDGPLHVSLPKNALKTELYEAFLSAGEKLGYPRNLDYNNARQEGFAMMPATIYHSGPRAGERCSTAAAYLEPQQDKINVLTGHTVDRILFDNDRARAIETTKGTIIEAEEEVILCAGAIETPLILERSGIGDPSVLAKANVDLFKALPGVGANLQDHLEIYLQFGCDGSSLTPYLHPLWKLFIGAEWLFFRQRTNLAATNHFEAGAFLRTPDAAYPDIQFHFLPAAISYDGVTTAKTKTGHSFQLHVGVNRSPSRGTVHLSPGAGPLIDFRYMESDQDWTDFKTALRIARDVVHNMDIPGIYEVQASDDDDAFLRSHLESAYHPCGTAKMGNSLEEDSLAVCSPQGKVFGVESLRVIDASLFPRIPNGNLNAPVIMTAEKLARDLLD